jgi:hypothetical protein
MLRQYSKKIDVTLFTHVLDKFLSNYTDVKVKKFEDITPDSFIYVIAVDEAHYIVYAEDYIASLEHVNKQIALHSNSAKGTLMPVIKKTKFEQASPVMSAATYRKPNNYEEIADFPATSGYDFVFLYKLQGKAKTK